jgi:CIC family chloride channel protein
VLFALEEIIGDMNAPLLGSTVAASVAGVIVARSILGNDPLFHVPPYHLVHPAELIAYAALGVLGGVVSLLFCKGLLALRRLFLRMPQSTTIIQPAIGGLLIGVVLMYWPAIMGVGYEYMDQALNGGLLFRTMTALCFLKLAATMVSYASGNAGGIFAPSLYIGAMAGGAVGMMVRQLAPFPTADPGAYALVGMGTLFAGIIRAPLTSVFMIFEITQDYQILVPLMVANMLSFFISRHYQAVPVYHALLQQDGVHLPLPTTQARTTVRTARHLMQTEVSLIPPDASVDQAWHMIVENGAAVYLVGTRDRLLGSVSHQQLDDLRKSGKAANRVASIVDRAFVHAHVDHPIDIVLERFAQSGGLLPVVSRADVQQVEGVVTIDSILRCERAPSRRESRPLAAADGSLESQGGEVSSRCASGDDGQALRNESGSIHCPSSN